LLTVVILSLALVGSAGAEADWVVARTIEGVKVEARGTPSGFKIHRGDVLLCTEIANLEAYIADTSRFHEWIPDLDQVRLLDVSDGSVVYYMTTKTPWPLKPRDMIYQLTDMRLSNDSLEVGIVVKGLPTYLPETNDAFRMREVTGEWRIVPEGKGLRVRHQLYVDPGSVPKFFANRRLATSLAKTLINLSRQFQCQTEP
jgi:hypothetical protein